MYVHRTGPHANVKYMWHTNRMFDDLYVIVYQLAAKDPSPEDDLSIS